MRVSRAASGRRDERIIEKSGLQRSSLRGTGSWGPGGLGTLGPWDLGRREGNERELRIQVGVSVRVRVRVLRSP